MDVHHLAWPRKNYNIGIAKEYRDLPENKIKICRRQHDKLHRKGAPEKPSEPEMLDAVLRSQIAALSLRGEIYFETSV